VALFEAAQKVLQPLPEPAALECNSAMAGGALVLSDFHAGPILPTFRCIFHCIFHLVAKRSDTTQKIGFSLATGAKFCPSDRPHHLERMTGRAVVPQCNIPREPGGRAPTRGISCNFLKRDLAPWHRPIWRPRSQPVLSWPLLHPPF
jgi:hypothetical protein